MVFPNIDPVAIAIGPLVIRWYALAYVGGIMLGYLYACWLDNKRTPPFFTQKARDDIILYAVLGIILGGRLGYILFYNLAYYIENPADMLQVWHGGMSFHGGVAGLLLAFWLFARKHKLPWLGIMDYVALAGPIGLGFGRLANFINGELYGRVTTAPWGMVFPHSDGQPRHPSQLYEAFFEGLVLFVLLFVVATKFRGLEKRGLIGGLFLAGYGIARFGIEFFRQPDAQLGFVLGPLSMGQLLCIPMILAGSYLVAMAGKRA